MHTLSLRSRACTVGAYLTLPIPVVLFTIMAPFFYGMSFGAWIFALKQLPKWHHDRWQRHFNRKEAK